MKSRITKSFRKRILRILIAPVVLLTCLSVSAYAQGGKLDLGFLERLSDKASETVEVNLNRQMLDMAQKLLKGDKGDEAAIKQLISGLQGVYVYVLEFDSPTGYVGSDLDPIRGQLKAPGWMRMVGYRARGTANSNNIEVFSWNEGDKIMGLAILSAQPKELVVVNIVGPIDIEKLSQLEGKFGIPELDIRIGGSKPPPKEE